jgi:hypothetical protein
MSTQLALANSPFSEYARATGWVCMRLSYADLLVGDLLLTLIGTKNHDVSRSIVAALDLNHKLRMLRGLATVRCPSAGWLERLTATLNRIETCGNTRHRYAHDVWAVTPSKEMVKVQFKVEVGQPRKNQPAKVSTIKETKVLVDDMYKMADAIDMSASRVAALKKEYQESRKRKRQP